MLYSRRLIAKIILLCTFLFLVPFLFSEPVYTAQTLTPDDIIKLKEAGVSDEVILEMIKRGKGVEKSGKEGEERRRAEEATRRWGLTVADITLELAHRFQLLDPPKDPYGKGVVITNVAPAGPAGQAGLQPGDVILMFQTPAPRISFVSGRSAGRLQPGDAFDVDAVKMQAVKSVGAFTEAIEKAMGKESIFLLVRRGFPSDFYILRAAQ